MTLTQASTHLQLSAGALRRAVERGEIQASHPLPDGPWIFNREELDGPNGRKVAGRRGRNDPAAHRPDQLTLFDSTTSPDEVV